MDRNSLPDLWSKRTIQGLVMAKVRDKLVDLLECTVAQSRTLPSVVTHATSIETVLRTTAPLDCSLLEFQVQYSHLRSVASDDILSIPNKLYILNFNTDARPRIAVRIGSQSTIWKAVVVDGSTSEQAILVRI